MSHTIPFRFFAGLIVVLGLTRVSAGMLKAIPPTLLENWATTTPTDFLLLSRGASQAVSNVADSAAIDGKVLQLQVGPQATPGPGGGSEIETTQPITYGTYTSRLKTVNCAGQPAAGVVTGYFTYFNDGEDYNENGLPDNSEIDFEWLCAEPEVIYLTMWTDYRDSDEAHRRVGRKINLRTGQIEYSCYFEQYSACQALNGNENQPTTVPALPGYDSSTAYYEYGFTWSATRVTWWIVNPTTNQPIVLWDYQGPPARIPKLSSYYMTNAWHTVSWTPDDRPTATLAPTATVSAYVDWTKFTTINKFFYLPVVQRP